MPHVKKVHDRLEGHREEMVEVLMECIRRKAIGPLNGGQGELKKAEYLQGRIKEFGITDITRLDAPDNSVADGIRPNIIARVPGKTNRTLWFVSHMDVVPEGDLSLWNTDPFEPVLKDGKIFGRGAEDNGQDMVASIFALRAILEEGLEPEYNLACLVSADEETGSVKGVKHIMKERPDLFGKKDLVIVPDAPSPSGEMIEIAEKGIVWLKLRTIGQQCHGSTPEKGINAHKAAAKYITEVDQELYSKFSKKEDLFSPPVSTFEVTRKLENVGSVNIIPGDDVVYFDNRVLPLYKIDDVIKTYKEVASRIEAEKGVRFEFEVIQRDDAAPPTSPKDDISRLTERCIKRVYGNEPYFGGIGGGTYAAMFRRAGIPAVVWGKGDEIAHQPNEYCYVNNLVCDSKVFAAMALTDIKNL